MAGNSRRFRDAHSPERGPVHVQYPTEVQSAQGVLDPNVAFLETAFTPAELVRKIRQVLDEPSEPGSPVDSKPRQLRTGNAG